MTFDLTTDDVIEARRAGLSSLPAPYYDKGGVTLYCGNSQDILPHLSGVTAVVTDPPYGLEFMGKEWDKPHKARIRERVDGRTNPSEGKSITRTPESYTAGPSMQIWHQTWAELVLAACVPGAPLLAFGGTRTYHRLVCAIEDAGWEIRDCLAWLYGSGFPKSLDISKAIDKAAGAEREVVGTKRKLQSYTQDDKRLAGASGGCYHGAAPDYENIQQLTAPTTPLAQLWDGWGTALKPSHEPICLAMKPLDGTFAANAEKHGVAGLNVDGCRVGTESTQRPTGNHSFGKDAGWNAHSLADIQGGSASGRWPANLIHDGSDEVLEVFPETTSISKGVRGRGSKIYAGGKGYANTLGEVGQEVGFGDSGSAARFFYCAKADKAERGKGNTHPTVKPLALMSYLCKLVSMPGYKGTLLDPFAGSGSTLLAASRWFENVVGIERNEEYCEIAVRRLAQGVLPFGDDT